jgi:hypothetical protein
MTTRMTSCLYMFLVVAAFLLGSTCAYRVGDAVDTDIRLASGTSDALRSQMPQFGMSSRAEFRFEDQESFSLQFEDGLRGLPWISLVKFKGQALEKLVVTFVYSKSGGGAIHSVFSEPVYQETTARPLQTGSFSVNYVWIEEAKVHLHAGQAVMFFAVFLASIYFICFSCGLVDGDSLPNSGRNGGASNDSWNMPQENAGAVPKWD